MLEMEIMLESWISNEILAGDTKRRQELLKKQHDIKKIESFLEYLKEQ